MKFSVLLLNYSPNVFTKNEITKLEFLQKFQSAIMKNSEDNCFFSDRKHQQFFSQKKQVSVEFSEIPIICLVSDSEIFGNESKLLCFVHPIFSSFGLWYFVHFSYVIFFPVFFCLDHLALQNVHKKYAIFLYFHNFFAKSDKKTKTKNGINKTIIS